MLANARFKVTNKDTGEMWYITTGQSGQAELPGLPVGVVQTLCTHGTAYEITADLPAFRQAVIAFND